MTTQMLDRHSTLRLLPTMLAIEALPNFEHTSRRLLNQWVQDKLLVRQVLQQQLGLENPSEHAIDTVHQQWLNTYHKDLGCN